MNTTIRLDALDSARVDRYDRPNDPDCVPFVSVRFMVSYEPYTSIVIDMAPDDFERFADAVEKARRPVEAPVNA